MRQNLFDELVESVKVSRFRKPQPVRLSPVGKKLMWILTKNLVEPR